MAEFADFLHQDEKIRIEGGVNETRRALALSRTLELIHVLGRDDLIDEAFVDVLRVGIESLDSKAIKALGKGSIQAVQLLDGLVSPLNIPAVEVVEPTVEAPVEIPIIEVSDEPVVEEVALQTPEVKEAPDVISPAGLKFLTQTLGTIDDLNLTTADAPHIAAVLIEMRGPYRKTKLSLDYEQIFGDRFRNVDPRIVAEKVGTSKSSLEVSLVNYRTIIAKNYPDVDLHSVFKEKLEALRNAGDDVSSKPIEVAHSTDLEEESSVEVEAHTFISVGDEWAERLEFNRQQQSALKEFLNPEGSDALNPNKSAAVQAIIDYVTEHFGSINNPRLNLQELEIQVLRHMTGAWYEKVNGPAPNRPMKPLSVVIEKMRRALRPELVEKAGIEGLHRILLVDTEAPVEEVMVTEPSVSKTPVPKPPIARLRYVTPVSESEPKNNQEISKLIISLSRDELMDHDDWRKRVGLLIQKQAINGGTTEAQAAMLWQIIHFDDEATYKENSDERREVMAFLQDRLTKIDAQLFRTRKNSLQGLKLLATPAFGLKTLDDVMQKFAETNPAITKESVEKEIVRGVGLLLR